MLLYLYWTIYYEFYLQQFIILVMDDSVLTIYVVWTASRFPKVIKFLEYTSILYRRSATIIFGGFFLGFPHHIIVLLSYLTLEHKHDSNIHIRYWALLFIGSFIYQYFVTKWVF